MKKSWEAIALSFAIIWVCSCKKKEEQQPASKPTSAFTYSVDGKVVKLTSSSANYSSLQWDFGDGKTGTGDTVTHTYDTSGTYLVKLTATGTGGTQTASQSVPTLDKLVSIKTKFGEMIMCLYDKTPGHKANFLKLTGQHFFDSTTFHRVVQNFVIQGGDPNSKDADTTNDGQGGPGYTIPAEINSALLRHDYGAVGAARDNNPQKASSGSQFYIVVNKSGDHNLDGNYTVFGMIIKGMNVAETIAVQPNNGSPYNRPYANIRMSTTILLKTRAQVKSEYAYDIKY